jgi:hypothetical protein
MMQVAGCLAGYGWPADQPVRVHHRRADGAAVQGHMGAELLHYSPSTGEWALLVLAIGLANAVYAFAAWKLGAEDRA